MKKKAIIAAVVGVIVIVMSGCSEGTSDKAAETEETPETIIGTEEQEESEKPDEEHESIHNVELPSNFMVATEEQLTSLPDAESLINTVSGVLKDVGVKETSETIQATWGNYMNTSGIVNLDAYVTIPQQKDLVVTMHYDSIISSEEWQIDLVKDAGNGLIYYIPEEFRETVNLYDYATGKLISEKKINSEDVEKETDKQEKDAKKSKKGTKKTPHREGMYGISDKDIYDTESYFRRDDVRNDVTGNWRISVIAESIQMEEYALSYYEEFFRDKDEVHFIVNFNYNTTTCIQYMSGCIFVTVHEYVDGEEHDAKLLGGGMVLAQYIVYPDNGDIEQVQ